MTITRTADGAVSVSYNELVSSPLSLQSAIEEAFGKDGLGIIIIRDLPLEYGKFRERLLKLAYKFAKLHDAVKEKSVDPSSRYSFGWSHGKEMMNGQPDLLKGSYYNNPIFDEATVSKELREQHPEYYRGNIWPDVNEKGIEGFEEAFKDLGRFIFKVGCELAVACQPFARSQLSDTSVSLPDLLRASQTTKARLLHYFPAPPSVNDEDDQVDNWCGFHKDHSLITGLCSAMFIQEKDDGSEPEVVPSPSPKSGLYIRNRAGDLTKVSIPIDCLAFQTGEALEVATSGQLLATPHCVRVGSAPGTISRETFALFMQPDIEQRLSSEMTFGQFSQRVFDEHYAEESM
ncbi:hypothetical protein C8J56DRAFT_1040985 [Mycena floridula]|nr:hypothetical protein C8J56DRAFT_1040985 [Mycena floridula]